MTRKYYANYCEQVRSVLDDIGIGHRFIDDEGLRRLVDIFESADRFDAILNRRRNELDPLLKELVDAANQARRAMNRFSNSYTVAAMSRERTTIDFEPVTNEKWYARPKPK